MTTYTKKRLKKSPRLMLKRVVRHWPLYIWIFAIAAAIIFYGRTSQFGGLQGVVEPFQEPVAPLETARLKELYVTAGQRVKKGEILAQMDTSLLDARIAVDRAKILEAQGSISSYQRNIMEMIHEFNQDIRDAEAELQSEQISMMKEEAELHALAKELKRREHLKERKLMREEELSSLRPKVARLEETISTYPRVIALRENRLAAIKKQRAELFDWMGVGEGGGVSEAVKEEVEAREAILNSSLERRRLQRESYTLRANSDGIVSRIYDEPGSVVRGGDPLILLISERSNLVVGFLPEVYLTELQEGQKVYVQRQNKKGNKVNAVVKAISPEIRALPGRISPIRNQPMRGRRVMVALEQDDIFIPGETVRITVPFHLKNSRK